MMIVDAIRSASTKPAVYFLATAYVESLRHFECSCGLPQHLIALPIARLEDLAERAAALQLIRISPQGRVTAAELEAVLRAALARLQELGEPEAAARSAIAPARTDSPHSSLSV